jgi:general secretion pathway protein K
MAPATGARAQRQDGVVLALVLVLALLLSVSMIGFARRAGIDTMIVNNRDDAARALALARGGIRLATALLLDDRFAKDLSALGTELPRPVTPGNTLDDLWNQVQGLELVDPEGGRLKLELHDAGALLNLNAVVPYTGTNEAADLDAEEFLVALLTKIIDEMPVDPGEKLYDEQELARNLIDYMDTDSIRLAGGNEDDYYAGQDPPSAPPNRPLLSVEELGLVEGFDVQLVEALRPYVTVYPIVGATGINLNTAPPHVLGLLYNTGATDESRLVDADVVGQILKIREEGRVVCTQPSPGNECVPLSEVELGDGSIFPPAALPDDSNIFTIEAHATVGDIERTVVAVLDRSDLRNPQLLFWRIQ